MSKIHPPFIARFIVKLFSRRENNHSMYHSFEEEFLEIAEDKGNLKASIWYWINTIKSIPLFIKSSIYWGVVMFKSYLIASLRNIKNQKGYSFINIIMAILGIPFALMIGRSGNMAFGIAVSTCLGLTYWIFYSFCLSLGNGGVLSPFISAWIANIIFGMLGIYLFLRVRQ